MWAGLGRDPPRVWILGPLWWRSSPVELAANEGVQASSGGLGGHQDSPGIAAWLAGGIVKIAALAIALLTGMSLAGASLTQVPSGCTADRVCLYQDFAFRGQLSIFSPDAPHLGSANDQASSVFNNTSGAVLLYDGPSYSGSNICLNPNTGIDNLALFGRNDAISSIRFRPAGGCG